MAVNDLDIEEEEEEIEGGGIEDVFDDYIRRITLRFLGLIGDPSSAAIRSFPIRERDSPAHFPAATRLALYLAETGTGLSRRKAAATWRRET